MPITPLDISDELKQAFRRLALNGNPHWVSYYSSPGNPPGENDRQALVGYADGRGRDTRHRAYKPYWYTQPFIDVGKLGFGFCLLRRRADLGRAVRPPRGP